VRDNMMKNKIRKTIVMLVALMMLLSSMSGYAITVIEPIEHEGGIYEFQIPSNLEDGNFEIQIPFKIENNDYSINAESPKAVMKWSFSRLANYDNIYDINYVITANTLVNGVVGDLLVKTSSLLDSEILYEDDGYAKSFDATTDYYGTAGRMIADKGTSVKLSFKNTKIFFLSNGWLSGIGYTGTYVLK